MNERFKALRNILLEAVEIRDPVERAAFVARACGPDLALRRDVEQLLQAEAASGQFLPDQPAGGGGLAAPRSDTEALGDGTDTRKAAITEMPGERIGRYKLLQKIGEGGCGIVYMAEQETPVRRRVALKVIKLGMDTKQVVARFEAERQALALMDHPNIAKVLDGGATEAGRPFFVMELVRGIPITRYCDENQLSTRQRLELFIQVCQAIQHAHQKGIVHRDIKPSNILVTELDGAAVPKVIDFGIAKATSGQTLTDKTLFTAFEQFIGTPAYMSPEQAQLSGAEIDARSDVYSLGVLLYELLTGKTPFDPKRLVKAGFDEVRRIIREEDPPRPSTRLSSLELAEQTTVARDRQSEPPRLVKAIRGDLDWIVMKTIEKNRARRYQTPNGLGEDIKRFLENEPVQARPPSTLYRLGKLVRRHNVAASAASVVLLTLVAASVVVTFAFKSSRGEGPVVNPVLKRIAILPFTNASPDRLEEYLSDSLRSELISGLRKAPGLNAFRAPAMLESMPERKAVRSLARSGVPLLVKGSLEEKDGQIKLTGRLIDTGAGSELVPVTCERELKRSLGMPNELALAIAKQCGGALPAEVRKRIQQTPTQNPEAYEYYLQGRFQHERFPLRGGLGNAIPLLKRAVDLDRKFAQASAELGRAYVSEYFYFHPERTPELQLKARTAIEDAFKVDPGLPEGHFAYGYFLWTPSQGWQHAKAMREYQLALDKNPYWEEAAHQLILIYLHVGLLKEGQERAKLAMADDPVSDGPQRLVANALFWQGNNSDAVALWQDSPESLQANWIMNSYLAAALVNLGRTNEATAVIDKALTADRGDRGGLFASVRALLLAKQGDEVGATKQIALALQQNPGYGHLHHGLYNIASAYALLNKPEPALEFLIRAAKEGFPCYPLFEADPNLNSLRERGDFKKFRDEQERIHKQFEADFGKGSS